MRGAHRCVALLALPLCTSIVAAEPDYAALGREVVRIVDGNFFDAERAAAWAGRHANYASNVQDAATFESRTNQALAELVTSHTRYFLRGSIAYWGLLDIFAAPLEVEKVEYDSIGVDVDQRGFVRRVLAGGAAATAGLLRGDRVLQVDGEPYGPIDTFDGRSDKNVMLAIDRTGEGPTLGLTVVPQRVEPKKEWLAAMDRGARVISREEVDVAYVPLLWCVGHDIRDLMQDLIANRFKDADALVLDIRDGWGGCNPDFLNHFNTVPPVLSLIDREGQARHWDPQWRKPLFVLINGGTRSGKEIVAWAIKRHELGTLVGRRTAGFVVGGRPFLLSDRSLLYIAVADSLTDGERLEGVGVAPHVEVPDHLEHAAGEDPQLEMAIDLAVERFKPPEGRL